MQRLSLFLSQLHLTPLIKFMEILFFICILSCERARWSVMWFFISFAWQIFYKQYLSGLNVFWLCLTLCSIWQRSLVIIRFERRTAYFGQSPLSATFNPTAWLGFAGLNVAWILHLKSSLKIWNDRKHDKEAQLVLNIRKTVRENRWSSENQITSRKYKHEKRQQRTKIIKLMRIMMIIWRFFNVISHNLILLLLSSSSYPTMLFFLIRFSFILFLNHLVGIFHFQDSSFFYFIYLFDIWENLTLIIDSK